MKYSVYDVKIRFLEPLLGTVAKDPEVYARYIASKAPSRELAEEEISFEQLRADIENSGWTGFHTDDKGVFLYDYQVMGFLKESANIMKSQLGIANLRAKVEMYCYVQPRRLYLNGSLGDPLERPLRAMTAQGPRVTLVRSDTMPEGTTVGFRILLLDNKEVTPDVLQELLAFGALRGFGQWRTGGFGRFEVLQFAEDTSAKSRAHAKA